MKKFKPLIPVIILLVSMGCEKEVPSLAPTPLANTSPDIDTGANTSVFLPEDSIFLDTTNILVINRLGNNTMIFKVLDVTCWGPECTVLVDTSNTNIYRNVP